MSYQIGSDLIKAFEIALMAEIGVSQERDGSSKGLPEFAKDLLDYVNGPEYAKLIADERNRILGQYKQLQSK